MYFWGWWLVAFVVYDFYFFPFFFFPLLKFLSLSLCFSPLPSMGPRTKYIRQGRQNGLGLLFFLKCVFINHIFFHGYATTGYYFYCYFSEQLVYASCFWRMGWRASLHFQMFLYISWQYYSVHSFIFFLPGISKSTSCCMQISFCSPSPSILGWLKFETVLE